MSDGFTMAEYVEEQTLGVDVHNPKAAKKIAEHLVRLGFVKKRRKNQFVWVKGTLVDIPRLEEKLADIEAKVVFK